MEEAFSYEVLRQRLVSSELGGEFLQDPLMEKDVWLVTELGYSEEEAIIRGTRNFYFQDFSLPWLKLLAKLTAKASAREKTSLSVTRKRVDYLKQLNVFLESQGYRQPDLITNTLLQKFVNQGSQVHRNTTLAYAIKLWREEKWVEFNYTPSKYQKSTPKIETIPEEVLYQIYNKFDLFPPPFERLFRLQLVLGCRIGELQIMPRQCLKQEGNQWFIQRWIEKRKHWRFYQIHPLVAELIREQQKFLNSQFGYNSDFNKLFCKTSTANKDGAKRGKRFEIDPIYLPELLASTTINPWLKDFSEKADLKDKHSNRFYLKSHQFRRTKASIMAHCETEDEYIAVVLGHGSLDQLPHYRKRSIEKLEKDASTKGYVDMYGRVTSFKPRKLRYKKLAELLKVSTPLGECHRPIMLGDCQYRYACLSCNHHRVTKTDKTKLESDFQKLKLDLQQAQNNKEQRRVTEINSLLELLSTRLKGLNELDLIELGKQINEKT